MKKHVFIRPLAGIYAVLLLPFFLALFPACRGDNTKDFIPGVYHSSGGLKGKHYAETLIIRAAMQNEFILERHIKNTVSRKGKKKRTLAKIERTLYLYNPLEKSLHKVSDSYWNSTYPPPSWWAQPSSKGIILKPEDSCLFLNGKKYIKK